MKRKILSVVLSALFVCLFAFGLAACGKNEETYSVTYVGGEGATGTAPVNEKLYKTGATFTVADNTFVKAGHVFISWNDGSKDYEAGTMYRVKSKNVVFTAQWRADGTQTPPEEDTEFTVRFYDGTTLIDTKTVKEGNAVTLPQTPTAPEGKEFDGWYVKDTQTEVTASYVPTADTDVVAKWKDATVTPPTPATYTVKFYDGETLLDTKTVEEGNAVTLPQTPSAPEGKEFDGWYIKGTETKVDATYVPAADVDIEVKWKDAAVTPPTPVTKYTVTYVDGVDDEDITVPTDTAEYEEGATVTISSTVPVRNGYDFKGWSYGGQTYQAGASVTVGQENITFTAQWEAKPVAKYTVTYAAGVTDNTVENLPEDTTQYETNAEVTVSSTVPTRADYSFEGWTYNNETYHAGDKITVGTENITLTAVWKAVYTVTYHYGDYATAPEAATADHGDTITLTVPTSNNSNYVFIGWEVTQGTAVVAVTNNAFTMPEGNVTVTAKWMNRYVTSAGVALGTWGQALPNSFHLAEGEKISVTSAGYTTVPETQLAHGGLVVHVVNATDSSRFYFFQANAGTATDSFNNWVATDYGWTITIKDGAGNDTAINDETFNATRQTGTTKIEISLIDGVFTSITSVYAVDAESPAYVITRTIATETAEFTVYFAFADGYANSNGVTISYPAYSENQMPNVSNPVTVGTDDNAIAWGGLERQFWTTSIGKGEKVVLSGTMTSVASETVEGNFKALLLSLYSGVSASGKFRADNYITDMNEVKAAEGWEIAQNCTVTNEDKTAQSSIANDTAFWATMRAIINKCNVTITIDWTNEAQIVVTLKCDSTTEGYTNAFTQTYTITAASGKTLADSYTVGLDCEGSYVVITDVQRTAPVSDAE